MSAKTTDHIENICDVCSETTSIFSIGQCDHPVCFKCATRMRVLCSHTYCPICRAELPKVAFTKKLHKFDSLITTHYPVNRKYKIYFEDETVQDSYYALLQHKCKECPSCKPLPSFSALQSHTKKEHSLYYCDICVKHLKVFSHERKCYNRSELAQHRRVGDKDDKSHKGHPLCKFCDERYLDNDELARHLRKEHYYCHFCDADGHHFYYSDYNSLRKHFTEDHFLCEEGDCYNVQFTNAFRTEIDLKAHLAQIHAKTMKKSQARQARTLDIEFNFAPRERKNRGHMSAADYAETKTEYKNKSSAGFGRGKGKRREEKEEEALARALSASMVEFNKQVSSEDQGFQRQGSRDFPSLGENSNSAESSEPTADSLAKKLALSSNMSVQEGSMQQEDFPTLGNKVGGKVNPQYSKQPVWASSASTVNKVSSPKVTKKTAQKTSMSKWGRTQFNDEEDFPTLGGKASIPKENTSMSKTYNVKKSKPSRPMYTDTDNYPVLGAESSTDVTPQSSASIASILTGKRTTLSDLAKGFSSDISHRVPVPDLNKEEDFPGLGRQTNANLTAEVPEWNSVKKKLSKKPGKKGDSINQNINEEPRIPGATFVEEVIFKDASVKPTGSSSTQSKSGKGKEIKVEERRNSQKKKKQKKDGKNAKSEENEMLKKELSNENILVAENQTLNKSDVSKVVDKEVDMLQLSDGVLARDNVENMKGMCNITEQPDSISFELETFLMDQSDFPGLKKSAIPVSETKHKHETEHINNEPQSIKGACFADKIEFSTITDTKTNDKTTKQFVADSEDFPSLGIATKKISSTCEKRFKKEKKMPSNDISSLSQLTESTPSVTFPLYSEKDFPTTLSSISQGLTDVSPPLNLGNVPLGLGTVPKTSKPPPGIQSITIPSATTVSIPKPPPGMQLPKPPPGLQNGIPGLVSPTVLVDASVIVETLNNDLFNIQFHSYSQPDNFQQRNQQLIDLLQDCISHDNEKFNKFKTSSGQFRKDLISGKDYYLHCRELLGNEAFEIIFPELLSLLPDIPKQQELLTVHKTVHDKIPENSVMSCQVCRQVLLKVDYDKHVAEHKLDKDFPSLSAGPSKNVLAGSWIKSAS